MKLPETGPDIKLLTSKGPQVFRDMVSSREVMEIFQRANEEYWPWEEFKYKTQRQKFAPEELWGALKLLRSHAYSPLPFFDVLGRSFSYWLPDSTLENLHQIDHSVGGGYLLEGADLLPEAKEQY